MSRRFPSEPPPLPVRSANAPGAVVWAGAAAIGWGWAAGLLGLREHLVNPYFVLPPPAPLGNLLALPLTILGLLPILAVALAAWCLQASGRRGARRTAGARWLALAYLIPAADFLRWCGLPLPYTLFEPLWLSLITGCAVTDLARDTPLRLPQSERAWWVVTGVLTLAAAGWWYAEGCRAYDDYLLGHHDFGHFARRVINTWEGRGFLLESPGVPAFWDHFNPGLALLAPLWGLWPNARLFLLLQAICLAGPAVPVRGLARAAGAGPAEAIAWSIAYLAYPAVGLMNLNYSYGWHPVSVALPLMFLAIWALHTGRKIAAAVAALVACSFQESIVVVSGCLAAAFAFQAWLAARPSRPAWMPAGGDARLAGRLSPGFWAAVWAGCTALFLGIYCLTPFATFQTARFSNLGDSVLAILLSPVLRPSAFWGQVLRPAALFFVLGLIVPWGLRPILRGWNVLAAAALPVAVLLAWQHGPATSLAFQYVTELLPIVLLAALSGAAALARVGPAAPGDAAAGLGTYGLAAACASLVAATYFGSLPWSFPTLRIMAAKSYQGGPAELAAQGQNPRAAGTPGHRFLQGLVDQLAGRDDSVLATGRIAAHLLDVRRLETVEQAQVRWQLLANEAGDGRSPLEVFDWILLDRYETFQQSQAKTQHVLEEARRAGYRGVDDQHGVILLVRPSHAQASGLADIGW